MWKPFIVFRKLTWLPMKYFFQKKRQAALVEYPESIEFLKKADEIFEKVLEAEREKDQQKLDYYHGAQSIIDWINMYGKTDEKRNSS